MQIIGIISLQALYFLLLHQIESKKINPQKKKSYSSNNEDLTYIC